MVHEPAHRNYSECPKQLEAIALEMGEFTCAIVGMGGLIGLTLLSGFWFDQVPERVTPTQMVELTHQGAPSKPGSVTSASMLVTQTLLEKPGGYLSNDIMPPGALMDNMPNFEWVRRSKPRPCPLIAQRLQPLVSQSTENPIWSSLSLP